MTRYAKMMSLKTKSFFKFAEIASWSNSISNNAKNK